MTQQGRWQRIGFVWFLFAAFAFGWIQVGAPVIEETRRNSYSNPYPTAEKKAADLAAQRASFEDRRRDHRPSLILEVAPGTSSEWIDVTKKTSFTWKVESTGSELPTGAIFAGYEDNKVKEMPIILPDDYEWKRPDRLRWLNAGTKPLRVKLWFF